MSQAEIDRMRAEPPKAVNPNATPWWTRLSPLHAALWALGAMK